MTSTPDAQTHNYYLRSSKRKRQKAAQEPGQKRPHQDDREIQETPKTSKHKLYGREIGERRETGATSPSDLYYVLFVMLTASCLPLGYILYHCYVRGLDDKTLGFLKAMESSMTERFSHLTVPLFAGSTLTVISTLLIFYDSQVPGEIPPSPVSPKNWGSESGFRFHLGYAMALLLGAVVFVYSLMITQSD